jgi:hypothetical protein
MAFPRVGRSDSFAVAALACFALSHRVGVFALREPAAIARRLTEHAGRTQNLVINLAGRLARQALSAAGAFETLNHGRLAICSSDQRPIQCMKRSRQLSHFRLPSRRRIKGPSTWFHCTEILVIGGQ